MAQLQSALLALLQVLRDTDEHDMIRRLLGSALQMLVDAEATAYIGADKHQRTTARTHPAQWHPRQARLHHRR